MSRFTSELDGTVPRVTFGQEGAPNLMKKFQPGEWSEGYAAFLAKRPPDFSRFK